MPQIDLAYGSQTIDFASANDQFKALLPQNSSRQPLTDFEFGQALDSPIESPPLEDLISPGDSVLIVTSDATRATASAQITNLLVRRLIQLGVSAADIAIIIATGIHRPTTLAEKQELLTPFITQRIRVFDHDAFAEQQQLQFGKTARGTPVELNRALRESTHVILTGGIGFHYFAGFTGGRKSICPGLASARTITATHMLALDFQNGGRRKGVGIGQLDGNAVHEECDQIATLVSPTLGINTVVDDRGRATQIFAGHWRAAHRTACDQYLAEHSQTISEKRPLVIVSCGGYPYDINFIQAHKALEMAAHACEDGGTIILLAECRDGLGRSDFLKWFESSDSAKLETRLRDSYEVNGQTAWAVMTKAERFRVVVVSELAEADVVRMRMVPARSLEAVLSQVEKNISGYVLPRGAALLPRLSD